MKKKVLIIQGHPNPGSYNAALSEAYKEGALNSGAEVREIKISELSFDPDLRYGYSAKMDLEPDLVKAQELLRWADHLVWIHPLWWGGIPAKLKGFIDRTFLPGFAFKRRPDSIWWDKLLKGKSAHIICTMDQPWWYYLLVNNRPGIHMLKKMTLEFCGVKPVKVTAFGPIRNSSQTFRKKYIDKIRKAGERCV